MSVMNCHMAITPDNFLIGGNEHETVEVEEDNHDDMDTIVDMIIENDQTNINENLYVPPLQQIAYERRIDRPVHKLSVKLIDTYKYINKVYYEKKAEKIIERNTIPSSVNSANDREGGVNNDGFDDENFDYILTNTNELFADRYLIKHRIGKGSFGQVVSAYDQRNDCEVAIKIIKSRKPFLVQAQTEIELLSLINSSQYDTDGNITADYNCVALLDQFVFRNHQCIVFEMLAFNLYELLKQTK